MNQLQQSGQSRKDTASLLFMSVAWTLVFDIFKGGVSKLSGLIETSTAYVLLSYLFKYI